MSLNALLHYDLDLSARQTGQVLAVVPGDGHTQKLEVVDLKQASIWTKLKLWWRESLSKHTISNFLSSNIKQYSSEIGNDSKTRALFETQCAKLFRKIHFAHKPEWNLTIKFEYPDLSQKDSPKMLEAYESITFDRLTKKEEIINLIAEKRFLINVNGISLTPKLTEIFNNQSFSGQFSGVPVGTILSDEDEGKDRTCTVTFSNLNEGRLKEKVPTVAVTLGSVDVRIPEVPIQVQPCVVVPQSPITPINRFYVQQPRYIVTPPCFIGREHISRHTGLPTGRLHRSRRHRCF